MADAKTLRLCHYPVGGRLRYFCPNWVTLGASNYVVSILRNGYRPPFSPRPPLTRTPSVVSGYRDPSKHQALLQQVRLLVQKGAIEEVHDKSSPGFYSRLFLVEKASGEWRPVIDLSALNKFSPPTSFKMETPESIRTSLRPGEWTTSVDLSDAYLHIPVHKTVRKFFRFAVGKKVFQFGVIPFGLGWAPKLFTRIGKDVREMLFRLGVLIHAYLDDLLQRAKNKEGAVQATQILVTLLLSLGFVINMKKSDLVPTQVFHFVGYGFDLIQATVFPHPDRVNNIVRLAAELLRRKYTTAGKLSSFLGVLSATEKMVLLGRLHMRPLQMTLKRHWRYPAPLHTRVPLSPGLDLEWWVNPNNWSVRPPLHSPPHHVQVFTDSSTRGWGAHCGNLTAKGRWSSVDCRRHINCLELLAVHLALMRFLQVVADKVVLVSTDNSTTLSHINKQGGTRSPQMLALTRDLLLWCQSHNITLKAQHIAGEKNVVADALSRTHQSLQTEWTLHRPTFQRLCRTWGTPEIDIFATRFNHLLPAYISPMPDPDALAIDALSHPWGGKYLYAFPPVALLSKVVQKIAREKPKMMLIAPWWPRQPWLPELQRWSIQTPKPLPQVPYLLRQTHSRMYNQALGTLNLHAFLIQP